MKREIINIKNPSPLGQEYLGEKPAYLAHPFSACKSILGGKGYTILFHGFPVITSVHASHIDTMKAIRMLQFLIGPVEVAREFPDNIHTGRTRFRDWKRDFEFKYGDLLTEFEDTGKIGDGARLKL